MRHRDTWTACGVVAMLALVAVPALGAEASGGLAAPLGNDLASIGHTLGLPAATWLNDQDGNKLFDSLERRYALAGDAPLPVIVTFRDGVDLASSVATAEAVSGTTAERVFGNLYAFQARLSLGQATRVAALDMVRQVEWDQPGYAELDTAAMNFGARAVQEHLGITGDRDGQLYGVSAKDVTIAVLDTGFHGGHTDLKGKFLAFFDAEDGAAKEPYDSGDHGTHVASIAAGFGLGDPDYAGVAPGAALVGFKITDGPSYNGTASGSKSGALWAYDRILELRSTYDIRVTTISFGFGPTVDGTDALELAVDRLWAEGIVSFKSAGNSGPERGTVTVPGGARGIISVANMHDPGPTEAMVAPTYVDPRGTPADRDYGFHLRVSSSRGPTADGRIKPDIAAPGSSIMAADAATERGYKPMSGTSMAAPFAAGTAALMLAADPALTPDAIRQILFSTAHDWGVPGHDVDYGHGRLDTLRAVQAALVGRLVRDQAPYSELARVADVAGPPLPFHASGILSGRLPVSATFHVATTDHPLAVTVIHNRSLVDPDPIEHPLGVLDVPPQRLVLVELRGPDDEVVGKLSVGPTTRQQTLAFIPATTGTHRLNAVNPFDGMQIVWDVSAGLAGAAPLLPLPGLPDAQAYEENLAAGSGGDGATAPALAAIASAAGLLGAACASRRGRDNKSFMRPGS